MRNPPRRGSSGPARVPGIAELRARLADAEETLRAIRTGEVDAVVVAGEGGAQVFTLEGAEHAYRVLIESMNEGALTLATDATILYANQCFARMVRRPLEQVVGSSLREFLSAEDRATLRPLLKRSAASGSKLPVMLIAGDGSRLPAQVSVRSMAKNGFKHASLGVVVTDMTEARRNEDSLRELTHRLAQSQESERGRVALDLHDHITQLLCATLFRCQALADKLSERDGPSKAEAMKLSDMLGETAGEVTRISRQLRPSVLDELGLVAALRGAGTEFTNRTGVSLELACVRLTARLPAEVEIALYRIVLKALSNVEQHAQARHVTVRLTRPAGFVQLTIKDDGVGFDADRVAHGEGGNGIGLLRMHERATYVGGTFKVKSTRGSGTEICVRVPLPPSLEAAS
jgi:two-component system NarL family sensor kinase